MNRDRIKRIVDVKRRLRDAQKNVFALAGQRVEAAERQVVHERSTRDMQADELTQLGTRAVPEVLTSAELLDMADERIRQAQRIRQAAQQDLDLVRDALLAATHDMRRVEALEQRVARREEQEARRKEQRQTDEVASRRRGEP